MKLEIRMCKIVLTTLFVFSCGLPSWGASNSHLQGTPAKKPNILVIMGDDVGWFNIGAYHRGIMSGNRRNPEATFKAGALFASWARFASTTSNFNSYSSHMAGRVRRLAQISQA